LAPQDRLLRTALARVLERQDRFDEAEAEIERLEKEGFLESEGEQIKARCRLRQAARLAGNAAELKAAADAAPRDAALQLKLAYALAGDGEYVTALDHALAALQSDRKGQGEAARQFMVDVFHALGPDDPITGQYRRKLSAALY
jgi:putative thioredoxin